MNVNGSTTQQFNLNANKTKTESSLEKMAKAKSDEINDAALRSIAGVLNSQASALTQGVSNANDTMSLLQVADGALESISSDTQRLNELSVKMNNGALSSEQKSALTSEFSRLSENISNTATNTTFNGQSLFGNSFETSLGTSTLTSSIPEVNNSAVTISSQESVRSFQTSLQNARSEIGSSSNALQSSATALIANIINTTEAASKMSDTDMASEVSSFKKSELLFNAATIAQAHQTETLQSKMSMLLG